MDSVVSAFQWFAVPASCVKDHEAQNDAWAWYGDALVPIERGAFEVAENGRLEFEPRNEED